VTTPVPLKQGQTVQLELVQTADKPVLKLVPPTEIPPPVRTTDVGSIKLVPGQQVAVEVIKLLAENRVLVQTTPPSLSLSSLVSGKPLQFDVDISQLTKSFKVGEKAVVEVLTTKPLAIALKADPLVREQVVIEKIKQLLPQLEAKPQLANLTAALKAFSLPRPIQGQIQHLIGHILDKQAITQPQALKQAIASSGVFTERHVLKSSSALGSDFKANLLKVAAVIEGELTGKPVQLTPSPLLKKTSVLSAPVTSTKTASPQLTTGSLGKSQVITPSSTPNINIGSSSLLSKGNSVASSQSRPLPSVITDTKLSPSPLSTGSLGKSKVQAPVTSVTGSNLNGVANTNPAIKPNVDGQVKTTALTSPFAFQNAVKLAESVTVEKTNKVLTKTNSNSISRPLQATTTTQAAASDTTPRLTLLSAILQALGAYNPTPSSASVLNASPSAVSLPTTLPAFLESVLTSQQAAALVQALNKSISVEQLRARGQLDVLVLQGLLKEVESLHARVQLNQFSMLKEPDSPGASIASWLVDLPIKDKQAVDFIQLQFDQFTGQNGQEEDEIWNVQLRLDTQNLGPLQATVTMHSDDVKIVLRAERPESAVLLETHIDWLHEALGKLGITVSHVSCSCGEVAKPTLAEQYLAETTNLVDVSV
jgi:hypothetical protein